MKHRIWLAVLLSSTALAVAAQEAPQDTCGKILTYFNDGDVDGALEEARWCVEALEQVKQQQESDYFLQQIAGWTRVDLTQNRALGFAMTEARYEQDRKSLTVSLTGDAGGASGALGGVFGAIAQAGIRAGTTGRRMRIQGRTAVANNEGGTNQVMVTLESGGFLQFSSRDAAVEEVVAFAEQFPIRDLDQARR